MIDINELNEWIKSEEGTAWANGLKAPLLAKRDELLESLRLSNAKAAEQARRAADFEKLYAEEQGAVEKTVVDGELARILKRERVMEPAIPGVLAELKERYALAVKANGPSRGAFGKSKGPDGNEQELDLEGVVNAWKATDAAKAVILVAPSRGGGALPGPRQDFGGPTYSRESIASMSPREVAKKLDDPGFKSALSNLS